MTIKNIEELFVHDGSAFVTEVYRNLLKREPDEHGLMYYLGRLAQGYSKAEVIAQLAKSAECETQNEIVGLKKLMVETQRAKSWYWRLFGRCGRMEASFHTVTLKLAQLDIQLARTNQHLAFLQEAVQIATKSHEQYMENLVLQVAQIQIISPELNQYQDKSQQLSSKNVEQVFMDVLGRGPESVEVKNHHALLESEQALREVLICSAEFQSKLAGLSEYARDIFQRQIQIAGVTYGD